MVKVRLLQFWRSTVISPARKWVAKDWSGHVHSMGIAKKNILRYPFLTKIRGKPLKSGENPSGHLNLVIIQPSCP